MLVNDINLLKLKYTPEIVKINDNSYISISEYEKRGNSFFDVYFYNNDKKIFIGRYNKEYNKVFAKYNKGKILIYTEDFILCKKHCWITQVLSLYDILDDTFYAVTEEEALKLFDSSIESTYIKNKNNLTIRSDVERYDRNIKVRTLSKK